MPSASWSLQQAIYTTVTNDAALNALIGPPRLYDHVPQNTAYPYLTLGQSTVRDWSTGTEVGDEHSLTLHVWSRASGRKEANDIMAALKDALHDRALTLSGYRLVNMRHELSEARREPDGDTYHGLIRFRAVTETLP